MQLAWHTDTAFLPIHLGPTALYAVDVVDGATATDFANCARAYRTLPQAIKDRLQGVDAFHVHSQVYNRRNRATDVPPSFPRNVSTLVDKDVESGVPFLHLSELNIDSLVGLPEAESEALIAMLLAHQHAEGNYYRHFWHNGDLLVWQHSVMPHRRPFKTNSAQVGNRILRRSNTGDVTNTQQVEKWYADYQAGNPQVAKAG
jgi:taurine dioxygenase